LAVLAVGILVVGGCSYAEENPRLKPKETQVSQGGPPRQAGVSKEQTPSPTPEDERVGEGDEAAPRAAAEAYYLNAKEGDWAYTYSHLDYVTKSHYTREDWFAKNDYLASLGAVTYWVKLVKMIKPSVAQVYVILTAEEDGTTSIRRTYFVREDGRWLHSFSEQEYDLLASAPDANAPNPQEALSSAVAGTMDGGNWERVESLSPSSASSAPASASQEATVKESTGVCPSWQTSCAKEVEVKVEVWANRAVDVHIFSTTKPNFPEVEEEVMLRYYFFHLQKGDDLTVTASHPALGKNPKESAEIDLKVYANGMLVARDYSDLFARVQYQEIGNDARSK